MKNQILGILLLGGVFTISINSNAQSSRKCSSAERYQKAKINNPQIVINEQILEEKTKAYVAQQHPILNKKKGTIYTIPVVIHIINNGEAVGVGSNITDAQAISQVTRLNEDFRLMNKDSLPTTHPFYGVQADCEIVFCLAKQDPDGQPTSGITRYNGGQEYWLEEDFDSKVKPKTIWDRHKYLNLWSTEFGGANSDLDGYGTFPSETSDTTDGIVIIHNKFGVVPSNPDQKWIIATHEAGHYFNLIHIWGDEECGDDKIEDTPVAEGSNEDCPSFPHRANNKCGADANGEMFMNYMDYSGDECTVMFTKGQKDRMRAAILASRASLLTSSGCNEVAGVADYNNAVISVYPNPANKMVNIQTNGLTISNLVVYSIQGVNLSDKIETTGLNSNATTINVADLSTGNYIVQVICADKKFTYKFNITK